MSIQKYHDEWEKNAHLDPLFAILSCPDGQGGQWDRDEFFATGRAEIGLVFAEMERLGALPARADSFLDFGCGVGRLSQALAARFARGTGVDISAHMVSLAREHNRAGLPIDFVQNTTDHLALIPSGSVSFVYSHIVLQHISNELQRRFIAEFARVLEPGGVCAFQIPTERVGPAPPAPPGPSLVKRMVPAWLLNRLKKMLGRKTEADIVTMEMNALPAAEIEVLLATHGCAIAALRFSNSTEANHNGRVEFFDRAEALARVESGAAHSKFLSSFYFARKVV
jgi:SAM-dependent methyltransferase